MRIAGMAAGRVAQLRWAGRARRSAGNPAERNKLGGRMQGVEEPQSS